MKKIPFLFLFFISLCSFGQGNGTFSYMRTYYGAVIGSNQQDASAILDVQGTNQGFLVPRLTTTQRGNIIKPATGLMIYNTTTNAFNYNAGTSTSPSWTAVGTGGGTVTSVTGSGNIASSGGATPNITFTGVLPIANGGTALSTLGTASQQLRVNAGATALEYFTPASGGITIGDAITGGGANRILFEDGSNNLGESATDFYFQPATPFAHVLASGRTGTITGIENTIFGFEAGKTLTTGARNVFIGYQAVNNRTDVVNSVVIGSQSTATAAMDRGVVIGYGASGATSTVSIGGESKNTSQNSVSIGYRAAYGVALGGSSTYSISIGAFANLSFAYNSSIAIGYSALNTTTHQGILGSNDSNGYIDNWYFNGVTHTAPYGVALRASGGSGTNINGGDLNFYAGLPTGDGSNVAAGRNGYQSWWTGDVGASGTTLRAATEKMRLVQGGDLVLGITSDTKGLVLKSPDGHYWRITIDNTGALVTTDTGTSIPN